MAAKSIQSDDLILVNRGGVDYRAKVSDLSTSDVDLDGYATEEWVEAKGYITSDNASFAGTVEATEFIGDGSKLTGISSSGGGETQTLQAVIDEDGVFTDGQITAKGAYASYAMEDTCLVGVDTATLSEESGDGHDINSVRGIQLVKKDQGTFNQTVKILTSGDAYFRGYVQSTSMIANASTVGGLINNGKPLVEFKCLNYQSGTTPNPGNFSVLDVKDYRNKVTAKHLANGSIYIGGRNDTGDGGVSYISLEAEEGNIYAKGTVEAKEFIGDGSKLTNVSLPNFRTLTALS